MNKRLMPRFYLGQLDLLVQLTEEASELSKAAAKMVRVIRGVNPTPVKYDEALAALLDNTYRPPGTEPMNRLLDMLEMVIRRTGMFELECTPNTGAARLSREEMSRHPDRNDEKESRCCHA